METEYEMSFAEFLKERRTAMGITQSELGKMIHVSKSAITKWETGRGIPDRTNLKQIATTFGITLEDIVRVCEGNVYELESDLIVKDLITMLEKHGYTVIREKETEGKQ